MTTPPLLVDAAAAEVALGPEVARVFLRHAHAADAGALRGMHQAVDRYLSELRWAKVEHPFVDLDLAEELAATCRALLSQVDVADPGQTALVGGAVRYFLDSDDASGDLESADGLVDDAEVVNYVIRTTGLGVQPLALPRPATRDT
ncbi:MAG: hypothetical protein RBU30_19785 [Polyangia bacterium]|jgi:hypothetical protein|nr:hypothetical protein [Polyangia bacterium]